MAQLKKQFHTAKILNKACLEKDTRGDIPLFDVVHPAFLLLTTVLPTHQGATKDGFWHGCHDMPKPCKFPSLDSCQKRFLWNHKEVDLTPHPVISFVLQVGDTEKSVYALDLNSLPFFRVSK